MRSSLSSSRRSSNLLDQPATLDGIGDVPIERPTRKAKRQRITVLEEEMEKLTNDDDDEALKTLENMNEVAKLSTTTKGAKFFKDFGVCQGIERILDCLSHPIENNSDDSDANKNNKRRRSIRGINQRLGDPEFVLPAANLIYLFVMRAQDAQKISDSFVKHQGVAVFLKSSASLILEKNKKKEYGSQDFCAVTLYKASAALWLCLGMIFCKSGSLMSHKEQMKSMDAILNSMDHLGIITNKAREIQERRKKEGRNAVMPKVCDQVTKTLHEVYRALNYLIDHVESMSREEIDSKKLFQRCHAIAKHPEKKTKGKEIVITVNSVVMKAPQQSKYKTDDATLFLNTKVFFVTCFQKGFLKSKAHFEEALGLGVETIQQNSRKASKNVRAQDRRHNVFELLIACCKKVQKKTLEQSGILGAIEATLMADQGTVQTSSKLKARELLKAVADAL